MVAGARIEEDTGHGLMLAPDDEAAFLSALAEGHTTPRRGKRVTAEEVRQVAEVYNEAARTGMPPFDTIMRELHLSRATAARRVKAARKAGLIEPRKGGTNG